MWRLPKLALGKMIKQGTHLNRAKAEHGADGNGYPSHHRGYHLFLHNENRKKQCVPRKALISGENTSNSQTLSNLVGSHPSLSRASSLIRRQNLHLQRAPK